MDDVVDQDATAPSGHADTLESIRIQAEDHPLIDGGPSTSINQHLGRLMHLKAYEVATGLAAGLDVLDVGCNTGYGTILLADVGRRVVGVDVSARAIQAAREAAPDGRPEFLAIDGLSLPFADASFDLVTSFQVIEHVREPTPYLREIARVLRPGGTVVLTTPNAATRLDPGMPPWNPFHVREYLAGELETELRIVFPTVRVQGMFGTPTLYEGELARVGTTRRRIRAQAAATLKASALRTTPPRSLPIRVARMILPPAVRGRLRRARARLSVVASPPGAPAALARGTAGPLGAASASVDLETFLRFTPAHLFYADADLERAMDFLATCRLD